jgi:hypothetical protein
VVKKFKDFTVILLSLALLSGIATEQSAHALVEVPTFRFGLGMMPLKFTAGTLTKDPVTNEDQPLSLGSMLTLHPMFLWDVPSLRSRIGFHFLADIGSQYGFVSTAGIGLTAIFYPMGLSSSRELKDNDSSIVKTKVSPYLQLGITPTKFSITMRPTDPTDPNYNISANWQYFSSSVVEVSIGAGVDYPFSDNLVGFLGLHYRFAALASEETKAGALSYSGMGILAGIMTNFYSN